MNKPPVDEVLLRGAENARIRARYHPTQEQQAQELERAKRMEDFARQLKS